MLYLLRTSYLVDKVSNLYSINPQKTYNEILVFNFVKSLISTGTGDDWVLLHIVSVAEVMIIFFRVGSY